MIWRHIFCGYLVGGQRKKKSSKSLSKRLQHYKSLAVVFICVFASNADLMAGRAQNHEEKKHAGD